MVDAEEFKFSVEWFDDLAGVARPFMLTLFENKDGPSEVSIYDTTKKRVFLKRGPYKDISVADLHKGALVTIYARQFKVVAYANAKTRELFETDQGVLMLSIPASCYRDFGVILSTVARAGFRVTNLKTMSEPSAQERVSLAAQIVGNVSGCETQEALWDAVFRDASSPSFREVEVRVADEESERVFGGSGTTATFDNCSLLVIKPHAVKQGHTGAILSTLIDANFEVSAIQMFSLTRSEVENFTEVYKGVISPSDYSSTTLELSSGPLVAVEVRAENCVKELREICGPFDVEVAKSLRPNTLRAKFGSNKVENAVHCTDLEEDGVLECQYFFDIMAGCTNETNTHHK